MGWAGRDTFCRSMHVQFGSCKEKLGGNYSPPPRYGVSFWARGREKYIFKKGLPSPGWGGGEGRGGLWGGAEKEPSPGISKQELRERPGEGRSASRERLPIRAFLPGAEPREPLLHFLRDEAGGGRREAAGLKYAPGGAAERRDSGEAGGRASGRPKPLTRQGTAEEQPLREATKARRRLSQVRTQKKPPLPAAAARTKCACGLRIGRRTFDKALAGWLGFRSRSSPLSQLRS